MDETEERKFKRNNIESRKEEKLPPWSELPCPVLEKIFSFLSYRDRDQMSLVCHKWLEESRSPSLWRRIRFCFMMDRCSFLDADLKIAKNYGRMFRHVDIVCKDDDGVTRNGKLRQLSLFLKELCSNSLLLTIKFIFMREPPQWFSYRNDYNFFLLCVKNLLKAQNHLKNLEFTGSKFEIEDGLDILDAAFTNNAGNLNRLVLRYFVSIPFTPSEFKITFVHLITNLELYETDYNQIFVRIICGLLQHSIAENGSNFRLREIKLKCYLLSMREERKKKIYEGHRGISSSVWKQLREFSPELNVSSHILGSESCIDDIEFFFKSGLPLKSLILELYDRNKDHFEYILGYFLTTSLNECLEDLSIVGGDWMPYLQPKLAEFLLACQNLQNFHMDINHPATGLEGLFRAWVIERPVSLKTVTVRISNIEKKEYTHYKKRTDYYNSLLSFVGSHLCLKVYFD